MSNNSERRKYNRVEVKWPLTIITDRGSIEGETKNITVSGMFIRCEEPLNQDEIYRIYIRPPDQKPFAIRGRVTWINSCANFYNMGFCFIKILDEDRRQLEKLLPSSNKV